MFCFGYKNEKVHWHYFIAHVLVIHFCSDHQMKLQYQLDKQVGVGLLWCGIIKKVRLLLFIHVKANFVLTLKVLKELSPKESISQTFTLLPISQGLQVGVVK